MNLFLYQSTVHSRWNGNSLKWKFKVFEVAGFLAIKWKFVKMERRWAPVFAKCCKHKEWKPSKPSKFRKWAQNVKRNSKYFDNIAKIESEFRVKYVFRRPSRKGTPLLGGSKRFGGWSDPKSFDSALNVIDSNRFLINRIQSNSVASKGIWADFGAGGIGWLPNAIHPIMNRFQSCKTKIFSKLVSVSKALFPLLFSKFGLNESRLPHNFC